MMKSMFLRYFIMALVSVMIFSWGLPHTIALRNIVMVLGGAGSLYFLVINRPFILSWNLMPLCLIYGLLVWVVLHYLFLVQDQQIQYGELKSLWLRVFGCLVIATSMGLFVRNSDRMSDLFYVACYGMVLTIIYWYLIHSFKLGSLLSPIEFMDQYLFDRNKVGTAFFSSVGFAIGCAGLSHIFYNRRNKNSIAKAATYLVFMSLSISASVIVNSKNGVATDLFLLSLFMLCILVSMLKNKSYRNFLFGLFLIGICLSLFLSIVLIHKKASTPGWESLFSDIYASVNIDRYQAWRGPMASNNEDYPINSLGISVADNTYERFSWMSAGFRELIIHPWGYGTINQPSFTRWLKADGIVVDGSGATHSGWLDLGLAFGFPAIGLTFSSLLFTLIISIKSIEKSFNIYVALWISLATLFLGFFQEVTYKHTFEALIFFISFCAACIAPVKSRQLIEIVK